ncbi:E3 ubiquitin-protein ligase ubr1 [Rhizoctonia solani]
MNFTRFLGISQGTRPNDPLARLRFALETMPGSRKHVFSNGTRADVLKELYDAMWGNYSHLFVTWGAPLAPDVLLGDAQRENIPGVDDLPIPGRGCGHIFKRGESCFRCRDCGLDDSTVMCARCFHATDHTSHNISFSVTQHPGGCCDCGDPEAWSVPLNCPRHPPAQTPSTTQPYTHFPPKPRDRPRTNVPPELRDSLARTIGYALDFLLDTLDFSPDEAAPPAEAELGRHPTADPTPTDRFSVILWNDEKHSFDEVIHHLVVTTGMSQIEAVQTANKVDQEGRDIIRTGEDVNQLLKIADSINLIDIGVTVRRAYDTFREQVAAVILEWLLDLTSARIGPDGTVLREIVATELFAPRKKDTSSLSSSPDASRVYAELKDPARIDWLFLYHTRLWKRPRLHLKQIYVSVLTLSHEHKLTVATHFAAVYHRIVDAYLLVDREVETSIKYFAVQLFTVPSVAGYIVKHNNLLPRILSLLTAFFTNQIDEKRIRPLQPGQPIPALDIESFPFRSKRITSVFNDLRYLVSTPPVQLHVATSQEPLIHVLKLCKLFFGANAQRRAASSHVEYETDAWISVFNASLSLVRIVRAVGEAFQKGSTSDLVRAIETVTHHILVICTLSEPHLDPSKYSVKWHQVQLGSKEYQVLQFDVASEWVSFHHSLHWLLAELLKHEELLEEDKLKSVKGLTEPTLRGVVLKNMSPKGALTVLDFPLRVIAMVAQIRCGLWVRNGFAIRGQLLHYRDFMLRELCYDSDVFLLQAFLTILDPDLVLVTTLDRFGLLEYFNGALTHPLYDSVALPAMVEEYLYVLITVLSEHSRTTPVRREIVHGLALGPCSYTELTKRVAERLADESAFDAALRSVANFDSNQGKYELRTECYDEVNPFFFHYTRNRREEVDLILRKRLDPKNPGQAIIEPRPLGLESGPYVGLTNLWERETLLRIVYFSLWGMVGILERAGPTPPPSADAVLDQSLHLIMLGIVEQPVRWARLAAETKISDPETNNEQTLIELLCSLENKERFKPLEARVGWCLDKFMAHIPEAIQAHRVVKEDTVSAEDRERAKKAAARARQDAIMKQFAAAQKTFLETNSFDGESDEDEDEDLPAPENGGGGFGSCIVCQEELRAGAGQRPFGALCFVQPSRMVRVVRRLGGKVLEESLQAPISLDRPSEEPKADHKGKGKASDRPAGILEGWTNTDTKFGLVAQACGHMMHHECFSIYSQSVEQRHAQQNTRNHAENTGRMEYICPLCKSLGNALVPVEGSLFASQGAAERLPPLPEWLRLVRVELLRPNSNYGQRAHLQSDDDGAPGFLFWGAEDSGYPRLTVQVRDGDHRMADTVRGISRALSLQTIHLRPDSGRPSGTPGSGMYLPEYLCAYTIAATEISLRGQGTYPTVVHGLSDAAQHTVRGIIACLTKLAALQLDPSGDAAANRPSIQEAILHPVLPEWSRKRMPFLLRDPMVVLVEVAAVAPALLPYMATLMYYAHLARMTLTLVAQLDRVPSGALLGKEEATPLLGDITTFTTSAVRHCPKLAIRAEQVLATTPDGALARLVHSLTLPFLRRTAILMKAVLPGCIQPGDAEGSGEYERLLAMLKIPPPSTISEHGYLQSLLQNWSQHFGMYMNQVGLQPIARIEYPSPYRLVQLPALLDELFAEQNTLKCKRCKTVPLDAAICLFCGTICCFQSHCCFDPEDTSKGECNMHLRECGGAVGLYFLVRRCAILYLSAGNGSFGQAPYLDVHGEVDYGMRRGRRQFLNPQRFEELRRVWLTHGIPTFVARKLDGLMDYGGWDGFCELELNNDIMGIGVRVALYAQIVLAWGMSLYWPDTFVRNSRAAYMTATAVLVSSLIEWKKQGSSLLDAVVVSLMTSIMIIFIVVSGTTREKIKITSGQSSQDTSTGTGTNSGTRDQTSIPTDNPQPSSTITSNAPQPSAVQPGNTQHANASSTTPNSTQPAPSTPQQSIAGQKAAVHTAESSSLRPRRSNTQWFIRFCFVNLWGGFCFNLWNDPAHFGLQGPKANCTTNNDVIVWVFGVDVKAVSPGIRITALVLVSILYFVAACSLFFTLENVLDPVYNFLATISLKKDNTTQPTIGSRKLHQDPIINKIHYFLHIIAFGTLVYLVVSTEMTIRGNDKKGATMGWSYGQVIALILLSQQFNDLCSTYIDNKEARQSTPNQGPQLAQVDAEAQNDIQLKNMAPENSQGPTS